MATLQEQIAQAKAAGYGDDDIAKHLATRADLAPKIKQATEAGYKPDQIIAHLSATAPAPAAAEKPESSMMGGVVQGVGNLIAGAVRGAGSIGSTLLAPVDMAMDALDGKGLSLERNRKRRAAIDGGLEAMGAQPDSMLYGGGKLIGEIAGTAGAGGLLARGVTAVAPALVRAGAAAPKLQQLANSVGSSGFSTGAPAAVGLKAMAGNMGVRMAGGATAGGAAAALIDPSAAGTGATVGAVLPPGLTGAGKLAGYTGRSLYSLAQPFTTAGQERIAGKIINKFAADGPTTLNNAQLVAGSTPTLAEATGNAGIAGLQRATRDMAPNRFVERETANAAARTNAFDDLAGDAGKLEFFKASRADAAGDLYGEALKADTSANFTPYVKGQITQLLKRPSIHAARKQAQQWAIERGEKANFDGSMRGLHDIKTALDDDISVAVRAGKGGQAKALEATKSKLLDVMEKLSPEYGQARVTYAEMSKPVNQMEVLQGLKLTDQRGNITLAKIQNAIDGLETKMASSGIDPAKSLTNAQLGTLQAIRDDLLRQSNLGSGRSAGSNTFQNIATDNVLSTLMPGKVGEVVGGKVAGVVGQIGKLMYSGPNEAIRNRLVDLMLDPTSAQSAMTAAHQPILGGQAAASIRSLANSASPVLFRSVPALSSYR